MNGYRVKIIMHKQEFLLQMETLLSLINFIVYTLNKWANTVKGLQRKFSKNQYS